MMGQMIGFSVVILISVTASLFGMLISEKYLDLIGFFPLVIGLYKYWELSKDAECTMVDLSWIIGRSKSTDGGEFGEFKSKHQYASLSEEKEDTELSYEADCRRQGHKDLGCNSYHNPSILIIAEKTYEYQDLQSVIYSGELGCGDSGVEIFDDEDDDDDDDETFLLAYEEKKKRSLLSVAVRNAFETCLDPFVLEVNTFITVLQHTRVHIPICIP